MEMEDFDKFDNPLELEKRGSIDEAVSFDDLYEKLRALKEIQGGSKIYSAEEIIKKIEEVRQDKRDINFITRSYGLREAVKRLLGNNE